MYQEGYSESRTAQWKARVGQLDSGLGRIVQQAQGLHLADVFLVSGQFAHVIPERYGGRLAIVLLSIQQTVKDEAGLRCQQRVLHIFLDRLVGQRGQRRIATVTVRALGPFLCKDQSPSRSILDITSLLEMAQVLVKPGFGLEISRKELDIFAAGLTHSSGLQFGNRLENQFFFGVKVTMTARLGNGDLLRLLG